MYVVCCVVIAGGLGSGSGEEGGGSRMLLTRPFDHCLYVCNVVLLNANLDAFVGGEVVWVR